VTAHASLGGSSAGRWMNCPGSPREIGELPESERRRTSVYAEEGTAAHALAADCLINGGAPAAHLGRHLVPDADGDYCLADDPAEGSFEVTEEMAEGVRTYLDSIAESRRRLPSAEVMVEQHVFPLAGWEDDMFGTSDSVLWDPVESVLVVSDLKYGAGVVVEAEHNSQTMFYGLGAIRKVAGERGAEVVEKVRLEIAQPRARHVDGPIRAYEMTGRELVEWGGILRSAAERTKDPKAPLVAGDWCKWCPAAAKCPALRQSVVERTKLDFELLAPAEEEMGQRLSLMLPDPRDLKQLAIAKTFGPLLDLWNREVDGMVQRALERGEDVPGFKLVRKRSNRAWKDEAEVEKVLRNKKGVRVSDIFVEKLRSPAQLEKIASVGKDWVAKYAHKPEGGLTVAPESDGRDGVKVQTVIEAFASDGAQLAPAVSADIAGLLEPGVTTVTSGATS